jgi:Tol biopolymer transport system component
MPAEDEATRYRARDRRLGREVALRVLPSGVANDPARMRRFEQELQAEGAINHPNVVHIHDVGAQDGRPYVVSELLEGMTLRERLQSGALLPREAVDYAIQIAHGLAAAHDKGMIHRDLRPENIFITTERRIKVRDFAFAALLEGEEGEPASPSQACTPSGSTLATVGYLSPEQLRGQRPDERSDLFALGAVIHEMLSGQAAFSGATAADIMSAVLIKDPREITGARGEVSPALDRIVRRCLEKAPEARFQTARDLAFALDMIDNLGTSRRASGTRSSWLRPAGAAILVGIVLVGFMRRPWVVSPPETSVTLTRITADAGLSMNPALSRDGKLLAYASDRASEGNLDIWVRQMAGGEPLRLTSDAADDHEPSFSPDGTKVVYRSEREGGGIYVVSAFGGDERLIIPHGHWPRFSPDGTLIACVLGATRNVTSGWGTAALVPAAGGTPREIESMKDGYTTPIWSPDGRHVLFVGDYSMDSKFDWWVVDASDTVSAEPVRTHARAIFDRHGLTTVTSAGNPDPFPRPFDWTGGRILFSATRGHSTNVWEVDIDPRTFQISGSPHRLTLGTELESEPIRAPGGRLLFSAVRSSVDLWSFARRDDPEAARRLTEDPAVEELPNISADGSKIAYLSTRLGNTDVWMADLVSGRQVPLTTTFENEGFPVITRDGTRVLYAFFAAAGVAPVIYSVATFGGANPDRVCDHCGAPTDVSRDGRWTLLQYLPDWVPGQARSSLAVLDRTTGRRTEILKHEHYWLYRGHLSPDERWVTFHGDSRRGDWREFIAPFRGDEPIPDSEWIAVTDGSSFDDAPRWSADGNELYYFSQRDGFRCVWAQPLDRTNKRPLGPPYAVQHFHSRRRSLSALGLGALDIAAARDRIVFNVMEVSGNIWAAEFH